MAIELPRSFSRAWCGSPAASFRPEEPVRPYRTTSVDTDHSGDRQQITRKEAERLVAIRLKERGHQEISRSQFDQLVEQFLGIQRSGGTIDPPPTRDSIPAQGEKKREDEEIAAASAKRSREGAVARRRQEEEAKVAARAKRDREAAALKRQKQRQEQDAAERKRQEEEETTTGAAEAVRVRRQIEESAARKKQNEEKAAVVAEAVQVRRQEAETAARREQDEEVAARRKQEIEEKASRIQKQIAIAEPEQEKVIEQGVKSSTVENSAQPGSFSLTPATTNPFKRLGRLLDLAILVGNAYVLAIPDTGSTINAISYSWLQRLGSLEVITLEDDSAKRESTKLGDGRSVEILGQVEIEWAFPEAPDNVQRALFRVYDKLADGVAMILGKPFLDATDTLTKYSNRLCERRWMPSGPPRILRVQPSKQHIRIYIDSLLTEACPDTGSELDLVSMRYAQDREFDILPLGEDDEHYAQLADGQIVNLCGKADIKVEVEDRSISVVHLNLESANDSVSQNDEGIQVDQLGEPIQDHSFNEEDNSQGPDDLPYQLRSSRTFYVFEGLSCDVLLGQAFLDSMNAFKDYPDIFGEVGADGPISTSPEPSEMKGIFKLPKSWGKHKKDRGTDNLPPSKQTIPPTTPRALHADTLHSHESRT